MSSARSIRNLSRRAGLEPETALQLLRAQGFRYASPVQLVAQSSLADVERALGLRPDVTPPSAPVAPISPVTPPPQPVRAHTPHRSRANGEGQPGPLRHQYDLPIVGHPPAGAMRFLDAFAVMDIHEQLVRDFATGSDPIDPPGARDGGVLLESAVTRPLTSLGGRPKYPTVEMAGAALLHALVHDHPFHNGNKRTGIVALLVFLDLNGYVMHAEEDELFAYVLGLAGHRTGITTHEQDDVRLSSDDETTNAAKWILIHSRKLNKSQRALSWRDLQSILRRYDCSFENREGNSIAIRRGALIVHAGARNDGDEVDSEGIAHIRRNLHLDEIHGIDSASFYYNAASVPTFINRYRTLLRKLAAY